MLRRGFVWALWVGVLAFPFMGLRTVLLSLIVLAVVPLTGAAHQAAALRRLFLPAGAVLARWRKRLSAARVPSAGAFLVVLLVVPLILNSYVVDVLTLAGLYVLLALGLNITVGYAGLLDLGYAAFYAIGAYTYAILSTRLGLPFWLGLPIGGIGAALSGMALGIVTLRLRGDYLAIVTLGFIQIVHLILNNWNSLTNGPNGILNVGRPVLSFPGLGRFVFIEPISFYYLILLLVGLALLAIRRLNGSWVGRAWIAIREDELAAEVMGTDTTRMKILAFTLGASVAGIAGVFFAGKFAFVSPESFTFLESVLILSMVVLGGMGNLVGVTLGAVLLVVLPELFRGFAAFRMLIFGAALVLMMMFRPQGILPGRR
jgi:branched-chain amino acid transport system permease protein